MRPTALRACASLSGVCRRFVASPSLGGWAYETIHAKNIQYPSGAARVVRSPAQSRRSCGVPPS
eukprot:3614206-Alexandrium_andersonii.AAC.1